VNAELAMKKDSAAILLVVAADHLIPDIGGANRPLQVTRSSTCWKVDEVPISGTNCFGIFRAIPATGAYRHHRTI
jgi:hypothetical protein